MECFKCHKLGHFQYECPIWEENVNYEKFDDEEEMLLMSFTETKSIDKKGVWFFDSGCNNHMCGIKDWFFDFDDKFKESVKLGDNLRMKVKGKGSIKLKIEGIP